jgi:excinuclease ABC subunit C
MSVNMETLAKLPTGPGVYFFKKGREVLYVGKATSLRSRVRSYFLANAIVSRGEKIANLIDEATRVTVEETDSVLEALVKEAALIKRYQPHYNAIGKSDMTYNYVVITDETFPRVFTMRERELKTTTTRFKEVFGPFPQAGQLRDALKIIRKIFPYRGEHDAPLPGARRRTSVLYEQIGLVPKDAGAADPKEYQKTIRHLTLFFQGKKKALLASLTRTMKAYARAKDFEAAGEIKRQLFALQHINDVSLIKANLPPDPTRTFRIEAYDIAHTQGTDVVGVMTVVESGIIAKNDYRMFKIIQAKKGRFINDTAALTELLERRFGHPEWQYPKLIVVDGGASQLRAAEHILKQLGIGIPVVAVTKNERHRPERIMGDERYAHDHARDILLANAEAHRFAIGFHRRRQRRGRIA